MAELSPRVNDPKFKEVLSFAFPIKQHRRDPLVPTFISDSVKKRWSKFLDAPSKARAGLPLTVLVSTNKGSLVEVDCVAATLFPSKLVQVVSPDPSGIERESALNQAIHFVVPRFEGVRRAMISPR